MAPVRCGEGDGAAHDEGPGADAEALVELLRDPDRWRPSAENDGNREPSFRRLLVLRVHFLGLERHRRHGGIEVEAPVHGDLVARDQESRHAFTAPYAHRSMQGTWTNPATGSHVMPRWCSSDDSAELATT